VGYKLINVVKSVGCSFKWVVNRFGEKLRGILGQIKGILGQLIFIFQFADILTFSRLF
jgi:hypothetical protein